MPGGARSTGSKPTADAIHGQLEAVLRSEVFSNSPTLSRFLRYVVEKALDGDSESVKEYSLGVEVFRRGASFDPTTDTIVRANARRLRQKLTEYYSDGGRGDPIVIELPKGGYVPEFRAVTDSSQAVNGGRVAVDPPGPGVDWQRWRGYLAGGLVVAAMAVAWLAMSFVEPPAGPTRVTPLTSFVGMDFATGWSPDGKFIAGCRWRKGGYDLFVMSRDGSDVSHLTDDPADDWCARWSPDGRWLAYLSNDGTYKNVYLIPPSGGARTKLAETNIPYLERFDETYLALGNNPWSTDGRELLFSRLQPDGRIAIWKVEMDSAHQTPVTTPGLDSDDFQGSWSSDGEAMVFVRRREMRYGLWLLRHGEREPKSLLVDEFDHTHPVWVPDNNRIVFESNRAGSVNLWEITVPSGRLRQLTSGAGSERRPIISPRGELAYSRHRIQEDLYLRTLSTGVESRLTENTRRTYQPRLSPDGNRVAYQSSRAGNYDVWVLDLETGEEEQVTRDPADDHSPDWSPDGSQLVFFSNRDAGTLWITNLQGGPARPLTDVVAPNLQRGGQSIAGPKWSPDGKAIGCVAAGERGSTLWVIDVETLAVKPLLSDVSDFGWYKDSRRVVVTPSAEGATQSIKAIDLATGEESILLDRPHAELAVSRDGSGITFIAGPNHNNKNLWLLRLQDKADESGLPKPVGEPEQLTDGGGRWHAHNGGWSGDGESIVYVRDSGEADIYLLENYQ